MVAVPAELPVKVTVQDDVWPLPATSVQVDALNVPVTPVTVKVTVPVGAAVVSDEIPVTVAVHVDAWLITTVLGEQLMVVVLWTETMFTVADPLLPL